MQKVRDLSIMMCFAIAFCYSCEEKGNSGKFGDPYDSSKPVVLGSFEPDSGGMATKLFITGSNFGNDPTAVKVYYNDKQASVVGTDGNHLYVITPRQPGESCTISVVVGKDSVTFKDKQFKYRTMTTVKTVTGTKGTTTFKEGTLATATFGNPYGICIDAEGNIFVSNWNGGANFVLINEEQDIVRALSTATERLGVPTPDKDGKVISVPTDPGDGFYSFDPDVQWEVKKRLILHPSAEAQAAGAMDFTINWKTCMTVSPFDGYIYTASFSGPLIKMDPVTRMGQRVGNEIISTGSMQNIAADPFRPNILYISFQTRHAIYTYDLLTNKHELYAGIPGLAGYKDGSRLEAQFNAPYQMVVDRDSSLVIADYDNQCIRKISRDGIVSTLIGKGGVRGYQDGNAEDALFDRPNGVAVDKDYNIYIADYYNNCVRKLAIE
ncbi:MAG: hypothetical protein EZS26_002678 [Candidatus Ordinivivax streblomastigis]|uniref:IPT/TIG domain-containing protein n=1 Tax=Candidatus Ordinivivax streblomastigis TaxID=2540710 RepID=A0A5M8NX99_9BACT|nr:MAG: hypothetical protein EZS26_002678 [Candidatus Ordinivivax streblomastigis]